ncbi:hybrid sensor histidine kinase/response regulator [Loktanella sp. M215]|uniref:hybrid sensor histidine kinase/response regulator n=1 Tax=Loktanella sp. M215 TaxID=2675431 RepID=UPI001F40EDA7|nr:PAS-domain containing protein [Loktanella sp. M215]MCF7701833.1 PAS domain-containing protein [Loktanella sp. M215]
MTTQSLINPVDSIDRQNEKLLTISAALIRRVEQMNNDSDAAYAQFQRAVLLEDTVRARTRELELALALLNQSNTELAAAKQSTDAARSDLANAIETIGEGFALFDRADVLVLCNSRFASALTSVAQALKPGMTFAQYVHLVSRSPSLRLPDRVTPDDWVRQRMARHGDDSVAFNVHMAGDRWLQVSEQRTPDRQTVIMQTDVTDIIRLEREERSRLMDDHTALIRATLDHIHQGVCIFNKENRLVGWNQQVANMLSIRLTQFRVGADFDFLFRRLEDELLIQSDIRPAQVLSWVEDTVPRPPLRFEVRQRRGRVFDIFAQEMPDRGFVISFTDVTAERLAAAELRAANDLLEARVEARTAEIAVALADAERANASKSRFVAAASHDLLQPLSAAKLYCASVADDNLAPAQLEILSKALNALNSVEDIIGALLDISQLESGNAPVRVSAVDLGRVLRQLGDELRPAAKAKGLDLRILPSKALVQTDASYLRRILQNLIGNAIRYTRAGRVLVGTRPDGDAVRIEVWDTGPGIPHSEEENIYKEFHRIDPVANTGNGLGLGLAIVERACALLDHHHGMHTIVGRGTCFHLTVPRPNGLHRNVALPVPAKAIDMAGLIVLLVEADGAMRRDLSGQMERWGVEVLDVASGAEASTLLSEIELTPDAMLIDDPSNDGHAGLALAVRLRAQFGPIPCRLLITDRTPDLGAACAQANVNLLLKPVDQTALAFFLKSTKYPG